MSTELAAQVDPNEFGIEEQKATELTQGLSTILDERSALQEQYKEVISLEITEENTKTFRELRLRIRDNRTKGIETWHKKSKEYFLRGGQFCDAIKNKESEVNKGMEEKLAEAEKHFENIEKERKAKLRQERVELLDKYEVDSTHVQVEEMEEETFQNYLDAQKKVWERKQEEELERQKKEEAREKAEQLYQERKDQVRSFGNFFPWGKLDSDTSEKEFKAMVKSAEKAQSDHEKEAEKARKAAEAKEKELAEIKKQQQKEREESEAKAKKEREEADKKLEKERQEREKLQKQIEAREKAEADAKAKEEAEKESRKSASDKEKLESLKSDISNIEIPEMSSQKGKKTADAVKGLLDKVVGYIDVKLQP